MFKHTLVKAMLFTALIPIMVFAKRELPPLNIPQHNDNELSSYALPPTFKMGWATAAYHIYGAHDIPGSNWDWWEKIEKRPYDGKPTMEGNGKSGNSCGFYRNARNEIAGVLETGGTLYRFSIDWAQLFPTIDAWNSKIPNKEALIHYHELLDLLHKNNITPIVTLHHFVHPQYFDEKGGFEKEENIQDLIDFAKFVTCEFGSKIPYMNPINEPNIYMIQSYLRGEFPPGKCTHYEGISTPLYWAKGWKLAGTVLKHMFFAHVEMYKAIKAINPAIQVGFCHDEMRFKPYHTWFLPDCLIAWYEDYIFNVPTNRFLETGKFKFNIIGYTNIEDNRYQGQKFMDFIGLNYYSQLTVSLLSGATTHTTGQRMTDMGYPINPEGFLHALRAMNRFGIPIIVTEAGLSDPEDVNREFWFKEHVKVLSQAIKEGINVIGATWWTLTDNIEWNRFKTPKFGLYKTDFENYTFTLRPGGYWIAQFMRNQFERQIDFIRPDIPFAL